jgi:LacI family transcriptional regulator
MSDIASKAGVSRSTVSLVLNDKYAAVGITEETRHRVLGAARQLGYRPNDVARAMVTGRNRVIAFLVQNPSREVPARILAGALREAEARGYAVRVVGREDSFNERVIEQCVQMRPAGVMALYLTPSLNQYLRDEMTRYQVPVAILDSSFPLPGVLRVLSEDTEGCLQAIRHLHGLGHRRIAHISGAHNSGAAALRMEGYQRAMTALDLPIPENYLVHGDWRIETTEAVTEQLLRLPEPPTAIFCADDKTAVIAARTAAKHGKRIPADLSLVGFADLEIAAYGSPALTTISQPFGDLGIEAVRCLLGYSHPVETHLAPEATETLLPCRLVVRASTGPVPS